MEKMPSKSPETSGNNVISIDEIMRKRRFETVIEGFQALEEKSHSVAAEFAELAEEDPETAIAEISAWSDKIRAASVADGFNVSYAESMAGPNIDGTSQIANILAAYYDRLNVGQRKSFVSSQVSYLNNINCRYSQMHVGNINDPRLIRDITVNAPLYWPGLDAELDFFETNPSVDQFNHFTESCNSVGLLAYTVLLNDSAASLPIKHAVKKNNPETLDGVMEFAAARAYHYGARKYDEESENMVEAMERYLAAQFAPEFIDPIRKKVAEAGWIHIDTPHFPFTASAEQKIEYSDGELRTVS